jgi:membrane protein implicated in regulation of membrane protease activity
MDWIREAQWLGWVATALVAGILEVFSLDFFFAMFAGGALAAAAAAGLGVGFPGQVLVFAGVSTALLVTTRPALRRWARSSAPFVPTNVHALTGQRAVVVTTVTEGAGTVKLAGEIWSARAEVPGVVLPSGATVQVVDIDGATAVVRSEVQDVPSGLPPGPAGDR